MEVIQQKQCFIPRAQAEQDPTYKQIIPYLIFTYDKQYFLMQRRAKASEQRLACKYSLGIGGHLRKQDMVGKTIFEWAQREFEEEVSYDGNLTIAPLGVLNDDSSEVGRVHTGFALLLQGDSPRITIKSELESGELVPFDECKTRYAQLETWSQWVISFLQGTQK
jgi:predicted NUDIX family phosphoesterase